MTKKRGTGARPRILEAAEVIANRDGARHLTLDAAAKEAGVSKGGVLYHFPTKEALLAGMMDCALTGMHEILEKNRERLKGKTHPTLRAMVHTSRDMLCEKIGVRVALVTGLSENPALLEPLRKVFAALWDDIRADCPDPAAAYVIWTAVEGMMFFAMFEVSPAAAPDNSELFERLESMVDALPVNEVPK
ncbi:TetR/AcrR family transcriptional regulator [Actibacterium lipolyticum]|uniref:HTH-type transcriptional regulator BetI n=1 Tax=Actibacterium lipolyticum TaxID=1524263 RepID=A0A238KQF7_9RHOB|nr:TetR/AcrR family transcriptional regulator [Actibacterium lipolyticum]SMX44900.1 HTH-type transcriptional regulator BetI [Actibacterium lipolyticum]